MSDLASALKRNLEQLDRDSGTRHETNLAQSRRSAQALQRGEIFFYGDQPVAVGLKDIDWTGGHVKHQEWPAQLNRFYWLQHLVALYQESGDEEMPRLARATIEDWIDQHHYTADAPPGPGDNTLNISIRLGQGKFIGWWGTAALFADSPHFDEAFLEKMHRSSRGQMDCLAHHLHTRGNWRISHLDCLLYVGLLVPGLDQYVKLAVAGLNEAFYRQIGPDGSHEEHNPSYHGWMCRLYTRLWRLAQARPQLDLRLETRRVVRMWDYLVCSAAPDGGSPGMHDGGVWKPKPPRAKPGDDQGLHDKELAAALQANSALAERQALLEEAGLADDPAFDLQAQPSRYFPDAGQAFLRESWDPNATWIAFDATRWGGAHCHLSRLSVNLYAGGRMLLHDPGSFTYEMTDPFAIYCKSTPAHNTVNFGGMSQTDTNPDSTRVHLFERAALAASHYEGGYYPGTYTWGWYYGKGEGVFGKHHRTLLWLKGRGALVFDLLNTNAGGQPFAAHWQFPTGPAELDAAGQRAWTAAPEGTNLLAQVIDASTDLTLSLHEGDREPLLGYLPRRVGDYEPAPLLKVAGEAPIFTPEMVTLLLPFEGSNPPEVRVEKLHTDRRALLFRLTWPDGQEDLVAVTPRLMTAVGVIGPIDSDGALAVVSRRDGRITSALLVDGLRLTCDGQPLIDEPVAGQYERTW